MQQPPMAVGQAMESLINADLAARFLSNCWDVCYDRQLTRDELVKGTFTDVRTKDFSKCQHKCIARHFEVMKHMNTSREQREKETAMGLAPGSLKDQM